MDLRAGAYHTQAAEAAAPAPAVHTTDHQDDDMPELITSKAVLLKLEVQGIDLSLADGEPVYAKSLSGQGIGVASMGMEVDKVAVGGGGERDQMCPECGKVFLSDKAMYGHLRSHPGRGYKGAIRPAVPDDGAGAFVAGDVKKPRKVPRTEAELSTKRARVASPGGAGRAPVPMVDSFCMTEEEAAMILLEMASGRPRPATPEQPEKPLHVADATEVDRMPSVEQPMPSAGHVAAHDVAMPSLTDHVVAGVVAEQNLWEAEKPAPVEHDFGIMSPETVKISVQEHAAKFTSEPETPGMTTMPLMALGPITDAVLVVVRGKNVGLDGVKKSKKRRLQDAEQSPPALQPPAEAADVKPPPARRIPSPASDRRYDCTLCNKTFPTHQALGGHMASHKRVIKLGAAAQQHADGLAVAHAMQNIMAHQRSGGGDVPAVPGEDRWGSVGPHPPPPPPPTRDQHPCSRCTQVFSSGQALGGHMRKHWLADKQLAGAPAPSREPRDFDLNELPTE